MTNRSTELGTLYVIGTPIGNLKDFSYRAHEILGSVRAIAAEDTRRTHKLLSHYEIPRPGLFFSCHEHNERQVAGRIVSLLSQGSDVALCSDAGMPLVNDPGFVVVREVQAAGLPVDVIPGPSAVLTALVASGLPVNSFTFKGFPPRKEGQRRRFFAMDEHSPHTMIFFEVISRLPKLLAMASEVLGPRTGALCVDLTKRFQTVLRGELDELVELAKSMDQRGEVTVVIEGLVRARRSAARKHDSEQTER